MSNSFKVIHLMSLAGIIFFDSWVANSVVQAGTLADENGTSGALSPMEIIGLAISIVATAAYARVAIKPSKKSNSRND